MKVKNESVPGERLALNFLNVCVFLNAVGATNEILETSEMDVSKPWQIKPLDTTKCILENVSWDWLQPVWVKLKANGGKKMFLAIWVN